ncbi:MAG: 2-oxo acid dehydrogenase subunit E2, partial [Chloroflexi bacterium]|nr:2-oxo acid dehydrogenase subunit E2 [Chloroflexota bacterium]
NGLAQTGAKVPVGQPIGIISAPGEAPTAASAPEPAAAPAVRAAPAAAPKAMNNAGINATPVARRVADEHGIDLSQVKGTGPEGQVTKGDVEAFIEAKPPAADQGAAPVAPAAVAPPEPGTGRIIATPVAKKVAQERGVDLRMVKGSGPEGRITLADVEAYAAQVGAQMKPEAQALEPVPAAQPAPMAAAATGRKPLTRIRQTIANRMTQSKTTVPHFYITVPVEMDAALKLREQINEALKPENVKVSVNDLVVRATALALKRFPNLNASFGGDAIELHEQVHMGVAVALESGLVTVTVRDTDAKSLRQIAVEMGALVSRAREGKAQPGDMGGQTFTISNLGMYGVESFAAIVNPPDAGILAVGAAIPTPVVRDGQIVARSIMHITLSGDHRVTDGAEGAQFTNEVKRILENPWGLVL